MIDNRSVRARVVERRTYNRPLNDEGTLFETWSETVDRVVGHQRWLWERAKAGMTRYRNGKWKFEALDLAQTAELEELRSLLLKHEVSLSGRTLWLGGTDIAKQREATQFNCSSSETDTIADLCDHFHLLLLGCGVGGRPRRGVLSGYANPVGRIETIRSGRTIADWEAGYRGQEDTTVERFETAEGKVVKITLGDSAAAWVKALGKLLSLKERIDVLVLDHSQIRAAGIRLKGFGWISSGDASISKAFDNIAKILSDRAGKLLSLVDIIDIENWMGTTLSSRRSAEIMLVDYLDAEWRDFATMKDGCFVNEARKHRQQSNNSLLFWQKPSREQLDEVFSMMIAAGGSEPGFINAAEATRRAPWFRGVNPCAEILLGNHSFCNLVEVDLGKFNGRWADLLRAIYIVARANYRQTCVWLKDGILQDTWHELNEHLRLCGVGLTGIVRWDEYRAGNAEAFQRLRQYAHVGVDSMADELGLTRASATTTIKPSGTLSKKMDTSEGAHVPPGAYVFNWILFSKHDPLVEILRASNYATMPHPFDEHGMLVLLPQAYEDIDFTAKEVVRKKTVDGVVKDVTETVLINDESAISQLERYKLLMDNYVDHNCSITVYYDPSEKDAIVDWFQQNWDHYVGVSFLYRSDPTKTAEDYGYAYMPQAVVTKEDYDAYVAQLLPVDLDAHQIGEGLVDADCATGACPVR